MRRLVLFFFFDESGIADPYIEYMLQDLKKNVKRILFVVNGKITDESKSRIAPYIDDILVRDNFGYDVWAYKAGIEFLGYDCLEKYDEFVMMNYTNFGPIYPFKEMFDHMSTKINIDFWGLSLSWGNGSNIPVHIQSHFITVRSSILRTKWFREYWSKIPDINSFEDALYKHEFVFTNYFEQKGFKWDVYLKIDEYKDIVANPLLVMPYEMLKNKRTPLIKRKSFFMDPNWLYSTGLKHNIISALDYINSYTDYDVQLIWRNMLRTQKLSHIRWTMGTDIVISNSCQSGDANSTLIVIKIRNIELAKRNEQFINLLANDIEICYLIDEKLVLDNRVLEGDSNIYDYLKSKYEEIILVEDTEIITNLTDAFTLFDKINFDNITATKEAIQNLFGIMKNREEIGALFSDIQCDYEYLDKLWMENYYKIIELLHDERIFIKIEKERPPIYTLSGVMIIRTRLLALYVQLKKGMKKYFIDDQLKWVLLSILIQNMGQFSGHVINELYVQDTLGYIDFMSIQKAKSQVQAYEITNVKELRPFNFKEMFIINLKYIREKGESLYRGLHKYSWTKTAIFQMDCIIEYLKGEPPQKGNVTVNKSGGMRIAFFVGCEDNRSERYRVHNIVYGLRFKGIECDVFTLRSLKSLFLEPKYDLFIIFREDRFRLLRWKKRINRLKEMGTKVLYDTDDYTISEPDSRGSRNIKQFLEMADAVTVSTEYLCSLFKSTTRVPIYVIKNTINREQVEIAGKYRGKKSDNKIRIVYQSGTNTHNKDFLQIGSGLVHILGAYKNVELHIWGPLTLAEEYEKYSSQIFFHEYVNYLELERSIMAMDINIAPLEVNEFNNAKSELKIFEAALLRIPTVCSAIASYNNLITDGINGYIAHNEREWEEKLKRLIEDVTLRKKIGTNAYKEIVPHFLIENEIINIINIYKKILKKY